MIAIVLLAIVACASAAPRFHHHRGYQPYYQDPFSYERESGLERFMERQMFDIVDVNGSWTYENGLLKIVFPLEKKNEVEPITTELPVTQAPDHSRESVEFDISKYPGILDVDVGVAKEVTADDKSISTNEIPQVQSVEATTYAVDLKGEVELVPAPDHSRESVEFDISKYPGILDVDVGVAKEVTADDKSISTNEIPQVQSVEATTYAVDLKGEVELVPAPDHSRESVEFDISKYPGILDVDVGVAKEVTADDKSISTNEIPQVQSVEATTYAVDLKGEVELVPAPDHSRESVEFDISKYPGILDVDVGVAKEVTADDKSLSTNEIPQVQSVEATTYAVDLKGEVELVPAPDHSRESVEFDISKYPGILDVDVGVAKEVTADDKSISTNEIPQVQSVEATTYAVDLKGEVELVPAPDHSRESVEFDISKYPGILDVDVGVAKEVTADDKSISTNEILQVQSVEATTYAVDLKGEVELVPAPDHSRESVEFDISKYPGILDVDVGVAKEVTADDKSISTNEILQVQSVEATTYAVDLKGEVELVPAPDHSRESVEFDISKYPGILDVDVGVAKEVTADDKSISTNEIPQVQSVEATTYAVDLKGEVELVPAPDHSRESVEFDTSKYPGILDVDVGVAKEVTADDKSISTNEIPQVQSVEATTYAVDLKGEVELVPAPDHSRESVEFDISKYPGILDVDVGVAKEVTADDKSISTNEIPQVQSVEATTYAVDLKGEVELVPVTY